MTKTLVTWDETHRLIMSRFPPIDLFDDIADPADWELLATAEARTNPRIYEEIGDLSLVPVARRLAGPGASFVMAAFTHISPDRASRFSEGSYGVYYAGGALETALREHTFHMARFYAATHEPAGWLSDVRQLVGSLDHGLTDLRGSGYDDCLRKDVSTYGTSQAFAAAEKERGSDGIVYPSCRHESGTCVALFYPDVVGPVLQGAHYRYHWDGVQIDYVRKMSGERKTYVLSAK